MVAKTAFVMGTVAALTCATQALAEKTTAEFASGATRPHSIALLPVEATVNRARVVQTEALVDEGLVYGEMFNSQLEQFLAAKGYEVKVINPELINSDPQLQQYVVGANRGFDDMMSQYKPNKLESRIYNAGESAQLLAGHLGVDALGFSTLSMTITAAGKAIVAGFLGGSTAGTSSNLMIVNGDNGDLEAVYLAIALVTPGEKTDQEVEGYVATLAKRTTSKIPGADLSARIDVALADDEVLDEVEPLLNE